MVKNTGRHRLHSRVVAAWAVLALMLMVNPVVNGAKPNDSTELSAAGTPERIGRTFGAAYADTIEKLHPRFVQIAVQHTRQTPAELYATAKRIEPHISDIDRAEMRGIAAATDLSYDDVLFLNCFYTLTTRHNIACRQLAVWGERSEAGKLIHARNLDWHDYPGSPLVKEHVVLRVTPDEGHRYLLLTWPGLSSCLTGTNEHGLTAAYNQFTGGDRIKRVAEPTFFTLKRVLRQCKTLDEAVKLIRDARPLDDGSVLISSAREKAAVVVEIVDGKVGVRDAAEAELLGNANHATVEAGLKQLGRVKRGKADWPTCTVALEQRKPIDAEAARQIMADRRVLQSFNIVSAIFVPEDNVLHLAVGRRAATREHQRFTLFPDTPADSR